MKNLIRQHIVFFIAIIIVSGSIIGCKKIDNKEEDIVFSVNQESIQAIQISAGSSESSEIFSQYNLLVVSITGAEKLFNEQSESDQKYSVYFEIYETDGNLVASEAMYMYIESDPDVPLQQKTLGFYTKSEYDSETIYVRYGILQSLSATDNALTQILPDNLNADTQLSRPCALFIDDEFFGIYNICYFVGHYNIDTNKITMLEINQDDKTTEINNGNESDIAYYNEMINFINGNSMASDENYQKVQEYLDIDNLIDYYIANIYSGNENWLDNQFLWRYKTDGGGYDSTAVWYKDGRFRWVIKSIDESSLYTNNTLAFAANEEYSSNEIVLIFKKLIENEEFLEKFINHFCDITNTNYETNTLLNRINEMRLAIETAISEHSELFSESTFSVDLLESRINEMMEFAKNRTEFIQGFLAERFSLENFVRVTLNTNITDGYISINGIDITAGTESVYDPSAWSGSYFAGTEQTLTAVSLQGSQFEKFIVTDIATATATEYFTNTIIFTVGSEGTIVQAIFK